MKNNSKSKNYLTFKNGCPTAEVRKNFISSRRNAIVAELATQGCVIGINENKKENDFNFYPNPASNYVIGLGYNFTF